MTKKLSGKLVAALAVTVLAATACDRSPVDPPLHPGPGTVEIIDRAQTAQPVIATWTHDAGWDQGAQITMSHGAEDHRTRVSLGVRIYRADGQEFELIEDGEYSARYRVLDDPANVIDFDETLGLFHGDHVHLYGFHEEGRTGTAEIRFMLWHDGHSDGETDSIPVIVTD